MNPRYLNYPESQIGGINVNPPSRTVEKFQGYNTDNFRSATHIREKFTPIKPRLPKNLIAGKKKKIFKEIGNVLGSVSSVKNLVGNIEGSVNQIQKMLANERQKFLRNIKKSGTQLKKMIEQKGGTTKQSIDEKNKFIEKEKENVKKILMKAQLYALKEINNRL